MGTSSSRVEPELSTLQENMSCLVELMQMSISKLHMLRVTPGPLTISTREPGLLWLEAPQRSLTASYPVRMNLSSRPTTNGEDGPTKKSVVTTVSKWHCLEPSLKTL